MATSSSTIRVRLLFDDCTPSRPGSVGQRKCWFLLNVDACRRVTDVEHIIRETFCLGKSTQIELFLEDFIIPPFERSEIFRENDLIRVKLLGDPQSIPVPESCNGEEMPISTRRKRKSEPSPKDKRTKKKVISPMPNVMEESTEQKITNENERTSQKSKKKKKKKNENDRQPNKKEDCSKEVSSKSSASVSKLNDGKRKKLDTVKCNYSTGSISAGKNLSCPASKKQQVQVAVSSKVQGKHVQQKDKHREKSPCHSDSSSSSSESEEDEQRGRRKPLKSSHPGAMKNTQNNVKTGKTLKRMPSQSTQRTSGTRPDAKVGAKKTVNIIKGRPTGGHSSESEDSDSSATESSSTEDEMPAGRQAQKLTLRTVGKAEAVNKSVRQSETLQKTRTPKSNLKFAKVDSSSSSSSSSESEETHTQAPERAHKAVTGRVKAAPKLHQTAMSVTTAPPPATANGAAAHVRRSTSKSHAGHIRFSSGSDSDSDSGDSIDACPPSGSATRDSTPKMSAPARQHEENSWLGAGAAQEHRTAAQKNKQQLTNLCSHLIVEDGCIQAPDSSTPEGDAERRGIQDKLLHLSGQQPGQQLVQPAAKQPPCPRDYSSFPPLVGPPRPGDVIAYKILELSSEYTPEVSAYKEGEVLNVDHAAASAEVRLSEASIGTEPSREGGRFELPVDGEGEEQQGQEEDGADGCTPPAPKGPSAADRVVSVLLPSLIEPKLIT